MKKNYTVSQRRLYDFVSDLCFIGPTKSRSPKKDMTKRKFLRSLHVRLAKVRYKSVVRQSLLSICGKVVVELIQSLFWDV